MGSGKDVCELRRAGGISKVVSEQRDKAREIKLMLIWRTASSKRTNAVNGFPISMTRHVTTLASHAARKSRSSLPIHSPFAKSCIASTLTPSFTR